jgi:hypothetical protein
LISQTLLHVQLMALFMALPASIAQLSECPFPFQTQGLTESSWIPTALKQAGKLIPLCEKKKLGATTGLLAG